MPWWCEGTPAISNDACQALSAQFDLMSDALTPYRTVANVTGAGATPLTPTPSGVGSAYRLPSAPGSFSEAKPQVLLYAGSAPTDRLAGFAHVVTTGPGAGPPAGYPGSRDVWVEIDAVSGTWMLPVWIVRGYENQPNVFAASHPCLATGVTLTATTNACFLASHTKTLEVLVTNDDGITAPGIDAIVEGLRTVPGLRLSVVAPATNQSGVGDRTTPGGVTSTAAATFSGFPGQAVAGTPADAVLHALNVLHQTPDLVVSGINLGQNMGPVIPFSGTVGAARTAARRGIPAVASSQGVTAATDFPAGAVATLAWVEQFRLGLAGPPRMEVANINIPSCAPGTSVRGTLETVVAAAIGTRSYTAQNCSSTVTVINDDIDAFNQGYVGIADARLN